MNPTITIANRKVCANAPFIRKLVLVADTDILYLPLSPDGAEVPMSDIAFSDDAQPIRFDFERKTCSYSAVENLTNDGPLYLINITAKLPKVLFAVSQQLQTRHNVRYVAFFQDHNGQFYIAGTPDYPLTLTYSQSITDQNNTSLFLTGRLTHLPYNTTALPTLTRHFANTFSSSFS